MKLNDRIEFLREEKCKQAYPCLQIQGCKTKKCLCLYSASKWSNNVGVCRLLMQKGDVATNWTNGLICVRTYMGSCH